MRTVNDLMETITINVTSWTMFLDGLLLHPSELFLHLETSFCICLHFQRVLFRAWIYSTSNEQRMDLRSSRNRLLVHCNGMLRNSRSHLAVQRQPPLYWIRWWWSWTQRKLEPGKYADRTHVDKWGFDDDL